MKEVRGTITDQDIQITVAGRIDSGNARAVEDEIAMLTSEGGALPVVVDAKDLEYISSAGLRVLLHLKKTNPDLRILHVSSEVYEILEMTGFTQIMTVEKAYRVVSVEGCEVIGEGANGKVYRIDQDNVVKTYKNADALSEIRHEREVARLALVLGVPTAISYDVVQVGDSYGSVFELLNSRSFAKILAEEPEKLDWCVTEYVELLKKIHEIHVPEGKLPAIKEKYLAAANRTAAVLPDGYGEKLLRLMEDIPDSDTMIHGDYHTKNIVLAGDEVLLIDMDTLSVGHPVFELAQMYNSFVGFSEADHTLVERFQGFPAAVAGELWKRSLRTYLGTEDETRIAAAEEQIRCVSYAKLIDWSCRHSSSPEAAARDLWTEELLGLLDRVDSCSSALYEIAAASPAGSISERVASES